MRSPEPSTLIPATAGDAAAVRDLLIAAGLPLAGLARDFPGGYVVARTAAGALVGCAGVESHGSIGLLRSVVVAPGARGLGLARALVDDRRAWATARGLTALCLLTIDAASYFAAAGFCVLARADVPEVIRRSEQFVATCPGSATCMIRTL